MNFTTWLIYVAAVFVLTVTPGPSVLMCITTAVHHGTRRTLFSALGSITAVVGIMALSALGLGAILAASEAAFSVVKLLGAAYLSYLGISTFFSPSSDIHLSNQAPVAASRARLFVRGFLVGASNPKALLFFGALFPQFIDPSSPRLPQFLVLGATFVCFELFWLMFYASFAARAKAWIQRPRRAKLFNRITGAVFLLAAGFLAASKRTNTA